MTSSFLFTPFSFFLFGSAIVALLSTGFTWQRRNSRGGWYLILLLLCSALWAIIDGFEAAATSQTLKIGLSAVGYIGAQNIPPLYLLLGLVHSEKEHLVLGWKRILLFVFPTLVILLAFTNEWHHLIWSGFSWNTDPSRNILFYHKGALYWYIAIYNYVLLILAVIILIYYAYKTAKTYRLQAWGIVGAALLPFLGNILWVFELGPFPGQNLTAVFFTATGIFMVVNIQYLKLLDLVPVARHQLVELMQDAMIVLDKHNRVVDINPAAATILGTSPDIAIGQSAAVLFRAWPDLKNKFSDVAQINAELTLEQNGGAQIYDLQISPLINRKNNHMGRLISLRDITEYKRIIMEVEKLAATDPLTGILNRRAFFEKLHNAIFNARAGQGHLCFMMFDIDGFKKINDQFGHPYGDEVLVKVAQNCQENLRKGEVVGRYGGDEFCIILPQTSLVESKKIGNRLRQAIANSYISSGKENIALTISMGVVEYSGKGSASMEDMLQLADKALYQAKDAGKNQIVTLSFPEEIAPPDNVSSSLTTRNNN